MHIFRVACFLSKCGRSLNLFTLQGLKLSSYSVIKSKAPDIVIPSELITDYVWKRLDKWCNKTAVICFETGRKYTYGQIYSKSRNFACYLQTHLHLKKGDTIAIILPNVPDFPIALLGSLQAGLIVTTVNPYYTADEISTQITDSNSKLIITSNQLYYLVKFAQKGPKEKIPIILTSLKQDDDILPPHCLRLEEICDRKGETLLNNISPDDVALLPYSSGTTGLSKGVQLTHRNVVSNLHQMSSPLFSISKDTDDQFQEVIPIFLPMFHIYGLVAIFLNFFSQGCKLITVPNFIGSQFMKLVKIYRPTLLFTVPPIIILILNNNKIKYDDLSSIRTIVSAAAPLGTSAFKKFNEKTNDKIDLIQMYGMTETSPLTLMQTTHIKNGTKIGGSGFLLPNTQCKIIPIDDNNEKQIEFGVNCTGELLLKGPQVMRGYHNNPEATKDVIVGDNWLKTGDIGHFDEDEHFFITDRLKELIKVKGFQVAPAELEEILKTHFAVADVAVVGVPHYVQGEAPKAFVVLKQNQPDTKTQQLKEFVASKVANYKRLVGGVVFINKIPRNAAGKVLRRELRNL